MDENYWYDVVVDVRDERGVKDNMHFEFHFASYDNALYVAKKWARCADVYHVDMMSGTTGEVYYYYDDDIGSWEKEI